MNTFTNSSLSVARSCLRKYDLKYNGRLGLAHREESEALAVGTCWHGIQETFGREMAAPPPRRDPVAAAVQYATEHAPNPLWAEKLRRLFVAHAWYWSDHPLEYVAQEKQFEIEIAGAKVAGVLDGIIKVDGRLGLHEYKTTADSLDAESNYWTKLRMDTQVGIYALAMQELYGSPPEFILYDVTRKPTIRPKRVLKKEMERMRREAVGGATTTYYGEAFDELAVLQAFENDEETIAMYGARLTADIGNEPSKFFARREVPRTAADFGSLRKDLADQIQLLEQAMLSDNMHRNPNACGDYGTCEFFGLCSRNVYPMGTEVPDGYVQREKLHPELD